jgi:NADH:ubiquinone oxidoreductase subunit 4 (subunit M)
VEAEVLFHAFFLPILKLVPNCGWWQHMYIQVTVLHLHLFICFSLKMCIWPIHIFWGEIHYSEGYNAHV